ncbi:MAG: hypothetical protein AB1896_08100 [Thermodesulfobacteriota bacterium]
MRPRFLIPALIPALLLLAASTASGGMALEVHCVSGLGDQGVQIQVTAANKGDQPAYDVTITTSLGRVSRSAPAASRLKPGEEHRALFLFETRPKTPGLYAAVVRVRFQDEAGRLFSALSYAPYNTGGEGEALISAEPAALRLKDRGRLTLNLASREAEARQITVRLLAPAELGPPEATKNLEITPGGRAEVSFDLKNRAALPGAEYPVLAFLEYQAGGRHYLSVTESQVRVAESRPFFKEHRLPLLLSALALVAAALLLELLPPSSKGGSPA